MQNNNTSQYTSVADDSKRESIMQQHVDLDDAAPEPTPILAGENSIEDEVVDLAVPSIEDGGNNTEEVAVVAQLSPSTIEVPDESPMVQRDFIVNNGQDRSRSQVRQI